MSDIPLTLWSHEWAMINNDSSFHSKHFIKFHQFIDNNNFFKLNNRLVNI